MRTTVGGGDRVGNRVAARSACTGVHLAGRTVYAQTCGGSESSPQGAADHHGNRHCSGIAAIGRTRIIERGARCGRYGDVPHGGRCTRSTASAVGNWNISGKPSRVESRSGDTCSGPRAGEVVAVAVEHAIHIKGDAARGARDADIPSCASELEVRINGRGGRCCYRRFGVHRRISRSAQDTGVRVSASGSPKHTHRTTGRNGDTQVHGHIVTRGIERSIVADDQAKGADRIGYTV